MNKTSLRAAFTLLELLIVISIIAILAGAAMPVYAIVMRNARMNAAMQNARQVGMALRLYANDYDGAYPLKKNTYDEEIVTSNDAFRSLIPTYLDNEKVFTATGSKTGGSADNKMDTAAQILEAGENHWAYISGLNSGSNSNWPLIVDHTDGSGTYSKKENTLGGTWVGTKTAVIFTDGSARLVPLLGNASGETRYLPRFNDTSKNSLLVEEYMGDGVKLLEPAKL
jgi:prepilin-type N-terminal cleavage/methylation domain-containing protein